MLQLGKKDFSHVLSISKKRMTPFGMKDYKIINCGITGNFLSLIKDLYKKTKCAVKIGNSVTDFFNFTKGVRQGCPMSPLLFNMFVNVFMF